MNDVLFWHGYSGSEGTFAWAWEPNIKHAGLLPLGFGNFNLMAVPPIETVITTEQPNACGESVCGRERGMIHPNCTECKGSWHETPI